MAGEEIKQSAGFLDPTSGKLRTPEELKKADAATSSTSKANSTDDTAAVSEFSKGVSNAFGNLKASFYDKANTLITAANQQIDHLKEAKNVDKEVKKGLEDLKKLFKEGGDADKIAAKKEEISDLLRSADDVATQVQQSNDDESFANLSLGAEQKGSFTIKPAEVSKLDIDLTKLNSASDVKSAIETVDKEIDKIKGQQVQLKDTKKEIQGVLEDTRKQIDSIESRVIQSDSEALSVANNIARQISVGSNQVVAHSLSSSVVQSLLT